MHCAEGLELPDYMMAQEEILEDLVKEHKSNLRRSWKR